MSSVGDFVIENGILKEYVGSDPYAVIPAGVTGIGDHAFRYCARLTYVTVPGSVESIGCEAFAD